MEIGTGASLSLVSVKWPDLEPLQSDTILHSYCGEPIPVVGCVRVLVKYEDQQSLLPLLIVEGEGPSLLGRNWLSELKNELA